MKRIALILTIALASPVAAQDTEDDGKGFSLMERGVELFFRGLRDEMEPALRELEGFAREIEPALRSFAEEMGPAFAEILREIEDFSNYHPPEILPNGDIIIRRKRPEEPGVPEAPEPGEEIEI